MSQHDTPLAELAEIRRRLRDQSTVQPTPGRLPMGLGESELTKGYGVCPVKLEVVARENREAAGKTERKEAS